MGFCKPNIPAPPDPAEGIREGIYTDIATLPDRKIIEQAAQTGTKATLSDGTVVDFTGLGEGDYQRQYADAMAQALLDQQKEFGPQYVQQRLEELQQSDPEGFAARKDLYARIMSELSSTTERPAAEKLQQTILGELQRGGNLDTTTRDQILNQVRGGEVARGNILGTAVGAQEQRALASASEQQKAARQAAAMQFLTTGVAPEDVEYRQTQQNLANLGSFLGGQTPVAQFGQLSGANQGAAPFQGGGPGTGLNPNAGQQGLAYAQNIYGTQNSFANQQANPWLSGLGLGLQGYSAYLNLGGGGGGLGSYGQPANVNWASLGTPQPYGGNSGTGE